MVLITTTTEIACSPAHLRKVFLDFPRIPQWTQGFIRSITPQTPDKSATELQAGDKLNVQLEGMSFSPVVLARLTLEHLPPVHRRQLTYEKQENSERQFMWRGTVPLLFYGDHFFRFEASKATPGGTTFSHGEEFGGILAAPFGWFGMGSKTGTGFEKFNQDLKREAEKEGVVDESK